ncbi:MAG: sigma-70 family RNA polymerase sigma factor [Saprospiraceae bacterium]
MTEDAQTPFDSTESHYLKGILENDFRVLDDLYARYLPGIVALVRNQGGAYDDACDVFQEAILVVFKKASDPEFTLNTPFGGYLYSVCRYIWWRQRKKKHRSAVTLDEVERFAVDENLEATLVENEKKKLFQEKLAELGKECRQVLQAFFAGTALKAIAGQMGYTEDYIKKKNKTCKERLATLVRNDRRYQELR